MQELKRLGSLSESISGDHDSVFLTGSLKGDSAHGALEIVIVGILIVALEAGSKLDVGSTRTRPVHGGHVSSDVSVRHAGFAGRDAVAAGIRRIAARNVSD